MNIFNRRRFTYMEAEPGAGGSGGEPDPTPTPEPEPTPEPSLLPGASTELGEGEYFLAKDIKGAGDIPDNVVVLDGQQFLQ